MDKTAKKNCKPQESLESRTRVRDRSIYDSPYLCRVHIDAFRGHDWKDTELAWKTQFSAFTKIQFSNSRLSTRRMCGTCSWMDDEKISMSSRYTKTEILSMSLRTSLMPERQLVRWQAWTEVPSIQNDLREYWMQSSTHLPPWCILNDTRCEGPISWKSLLPAGSRRMTWGVRGTSSLW